MNIAFWKVSLFPLPKFIRKFMGDEETVEKQDNTATENVNKTQTTEKQPITENKPTEKTSEQLSTAKEPIKTEPKPVVKVQEPPKAEKKVKKEKVKKEKVKKEKTSAESPLGDIDFSFGLIKQVVSSAKGIMKRILKAIKFRDVSFTIPIYDEDVLTTQRKYAAVTSSFYTLSIFLQKHLQLYYKSPVFVADFANQHADSLYFYCKISASPILLIVAAFYAYKQYKIIIKNNKTGEKLTGKGE